MDDIEDYIQKQISDDVLELAEIEDCELDEILREVRA